MADDTKHQNTTSQILRGRWTKFVRDMTTGPCRQVSTKLFRKWSENSRGLNTIREEARYE